MRVNLELSVNGKPVRLEVEGDRTLLSVLRDDLGLTGAKYGCGEGQCGACTVLVDGDPARACLAKVAALAGRAVTTIEGLAKDDALHPVQQAFLDADALQCGFCTPGMIMEGAALLQKGGGLTMRTLAERMNGHICRCGTYQRILAALSMLALRQAEKPQ